jgi:hypothetical protein
VKGVLPIDTSPQRRLHGRAVLVSLHEYVLEDEAAKYD